jgi:hypothetical protein
MTKKKIDPKYLTTDIDVHDLIASPFCKPVDDPDDLPSAGYNKPQFDIDKQLQISKEDIEQNRNEALAKIQNHVEKSFAAIKKEDLSTYMLDNRITLLEQSKFMLSEYMVSILTSGISDARKFEVLSKMIEITAKVNDSVAVPEKESKNVEKTKAEQEKFIMNTANVVGDIIKTNLEQFAEKSNFKEKDKTKIKVLENAK